MEDSKILETFSDEGTFEIGRKMAEAAAPGAIICLDGDLGTGKTIFAKGFAAGLGVKEPVSSPTFTIVQEYDEGRIPFYHFDVYRITDPEEMEEIGIDDYLFGEGACLIEWAGQIEELIPEGSVHVLIEKDPERGFDYRRVTIRPASAADTAGLASAEETDGREEQSR